MILKKILETNIFHHTILLLTLIITSQSCHQYCFVERCSCCPVWSAFECTSCLSGYTQAGGICQNSSAIAPSCASFSPSGTCLSCYHNLLLTSTKTCQACSNFINDCLRCTSETACIQCYLTHYLVAPTICVPCQFSMKFCYTCLTSNKCLSCLSTLYTLTAAETECGLCSDFIPNCDQCTSRTVCTVCISNTMIFKPSAASCV